MREDDVRLQRAKLLNEAVDELVGRPQRVVTGVEETQLRAERFPRPLGLSTADVLDRVERRALLPELCRFAALAVGETEDSHAVATLCVQRDGTSRAPDKIGGMSADDQDGALRGSHHHDASVNRMSRPPVPHDARRERRSVRHTMVYCRMSREV